MKKLLAALLIIVFSALTVLTVAIQSARSILLDAELLKQELRDAKVYDLAVDLTIEELQKNSDAFEDVVPLLGAEEITSAFRSVISPSTIQTQTEAAIDQIYTWFTSSADIRDSKIVFSLGEVKSRAGSIAMTLLQKKFNSLPTCTPGELAQSSVSDILDRGTCRPPDVILTDLIQEADVTTALQELPDQIDVIELISQSADKGGEGESNTQGVSQADETFQMLNSTRDRINQGIVALKTLTIILLLVWLLIAALSTGSARAFFAWTGVPLLLAGITLIVPSVFLIQDVSTRLDALFIGGELPEAAKVLVSKIANDIITLIFSSVRTKGIMLGSIGFFFLMVSLFIPPPKQSKKKDAVPQIQKISLHEKLGITDNLSKRPDKPEKTT